MSKRTLVTGLMAFILAAGPAVASADGLLLQREALDDGRYAALTAAIEKARAETPGAFEAFDQLRLHLRDMDANKRGPYAPVAARLRAMGPQALMPMLEALAVDAEPVGTLPESAQVAWLSGLVEATGDLRDPRARPVLSAIVASDVRDFDILRSAVKALALQEDDASAAQLIPLVVKAGPKRHAALAGIGYARRLDVVQALGQALASGLPEAEALDAARSLASAGNSWVWKRRGGDQGEPVRRLAAAVLVKAFAAYSGQARAAAGKALLVVDHPEAGALVQAALKHARGDLRSDLEQLAKRLASNPVRVP